VLSLGGGHRERDGVCDVAVNEPHC
jgi:hypothetical protein